VDGNFAALCGTLGGEALYAPAVVGHCISMAEAKVAPEVLQG